MGSAIAHTMSSRNCPVCKKPLEKKKAHKNCASTITVKYSDGQDVTLHRDPSTLQFHCLCDKKTKAHSFSARQGLKYHISSLGANWVVCAMVLAITHS
jgi:hypothetical protein